MKSQKEGLALIQTIIDKWTNKYLKKTVHLFDKTGEYQTYLLFSHN